MFGLRGVFCCFRSFVNSSEYVVGSIYGFPDFRLEFQVCAGLEFGGRVFGGFDVLLFWVGGLDGCLGWGVVRISDPPGSGMGRC